jgi:voltage-gated potassium channel
MLAVALLVLPLLAAEYFLSRQVQQSAGLLLFARGAESLIWTAFAFEFIVLISLAERKWRFAREHWIDVLIICLPLVAFLRMARIGRLLRLGQLGRVQQALRALRLFRLRVTALRVWRALLLLEVADRVVRATPERKLARLREEVAARERELQTLRQEVAELETRIADELSDAVSEPAA